MLYTGVKAVGKGKKPKAPIAEPESEDETTSTVQYPPVKEKKSRAPMSDEQKAKLKAGRDAKTAAKAAGFTSAAEHQAHVKESADAEKAANDAIQKSEDAKAAKKAAAKAKRDAKKLETPSAVQESTPSATSVSGSEGKVSKRKPKSAGPKDGDEQVVALKRVPIEKAVSKKRKATEPKKFKAQRTKAVKIAERVEQEVTKQMKSRIFPDRIF